MHLAPPASSRELRTVRHDADLVVVGGGLAGTCCAITAARAGLRVVLVQDRPVLGGNASSEVRLWILGATSHMGNNNRWAREGGVIDEILVENMFRNPEGNPLLVDALLLEKVAAERNITLLLNTAVHELTKRDADTIESVRAFCAQNSTRYELHAPLFCDASGDGIVGFMAGAAFRVGAESRAEFGEGFAPETAGGDLLGHSLYFYSKDTGRPVQFTAPGFALTDITKIPRWRQFNAREHGCKLWWIEHGGLLDTVHDTERIKWELWQVVYGVWHHIKNSGQFPEAANLTLEWVGHIPGKRESRRFEGDYILRQQDIVEQRSHPDTVAFGGWAMDLHPVEGVFSAESGCTQWHAKGVYPIPYRCLYSRNLTNLFLAGRIISASHVAFGSSRVMATCALTGQAVGLAAALCRRGGIAPRALGAPARIGGLQRALLRVGHHLPGVTLQDDTDLAPRAVISATSELRLAELPPDGPSVSLDDGWAMMLPVAAGARLELTVFADVAQAAELRAELRQSARPDNHSPDVTLERITMPLPPGANQPVVVRFAPTFTDTRYAFVCFFGSGAVRLRTSERRLTGVLSLCHKVNLAVATSATQMPPPGIGIDTFEFWQPQRRPEGRNLALRLATPLAAFAAHHVVNGVARPTCQPNAWVADFADTAPVLTLRWPTPQVIACVELMFDVDYDHPMESVLMGHPERRMPFCVARYRVRDDTGAVLAECADNHHARNVLVLPQPVTTRELHVELTAPAAHVPAALFAVRCYPAAGSR
ncbi:MAG: FAD-dependent oxidoreductase [Verrucomicrobia bacterium]|nr:FAD-dependent oxidoreductase [Verrucomicrobiota bacterium]